jgi:ABC-type transporter Mla maintaining outer membrane lipid asymmetry ATPase subunit MlaF
MIPIESAEIIHQKMLLSKLFSGIGLALIGRSGCGKTSIMAKLAVSTADKNGTIPTILRFCGTSQFSLNGLVDEVFVFSFLLLMGD